MSNFKKADDGKPKLSLIPFRALNGVSKVLEFGADKYGRDNWKNANTGDLERFIDATLRHIFAFIEGETIDKESKLHHLDHAITNLLFYRWHELQKPKDEDWAVWENWDE